MLQKQCQKNYLSFTIPHFISTCAYRPIKHFSGKWSNSPISTCASMRGNTVIARKIFDEKYFWQLTEF